MRTLKERRKAAAYSNTEPTLTDQSARATTDLNVIVNQFLKTGQSQSRSIPRYGDFTQIPTDLRGIIETSRSMNDYRRKLPEQLRGMSIQELLQLTPETLKRILTPPTTPPAKPEEPKT